MITACARAVGELRGHVIDFLRDLHVQAALSARVCIVRRGTCRSRVCAAIEPRRLDHGWRCRPLKPVQARDHLESPETMILRRPLKNKTDELAGPTADRIDRHVTGAARRSIGPTIVKPRLAARF